MVHSDLKSTDLCGYDNSASSMHWVLDPVQTRTQFNVGGPGVPTGVGLNTPGEVISVEDMPAKAKLQYLYEGMLPNTFNVLKALI